MAQYKHHILSAKEIGKSLLLGTPDYSPFHQSIDAAQETLYYLNYLQGQFTLQMGKHLLLIGHHSLVEMYLSMELQLK